MFKNMTAKESLKSKGMLAGYGLMGLGVYMIFDGQNEFGMGLIMTGLGIMGLRDSK